MKGIVQPSAINQKETTMPKAKSKLTLSASVPKTPAPDPAVTCARFGYGKFPRKSLPNMRVRCLKCGFIHNPPRLNLV